MNNEPVPEHLKKRVIRETELLIALQKHHDPTLNLSSLAHKDCPVCKDVVPPNAPFEDGFDVNAYMDGTGPYTPKN